MRQKDNKSAKCICFITEHDRYSLYTYNVQFMYSIYQGSKIWVSRYDPQNTFKLHPGLIASEPVLFLQQPDSDQADVSHLVSAYFSSGLSLVTPGLWLAGADPLYARCVMPRCLFSRRPVFTQTGSREIVKIITGRHRGWPGAGINATVCVK